MHAQGACRATLWELQPPAAEESALSHRAGQSRNCLTVFSSVNLEQAVLNVHLTTSHNKTDLLHEEDFDPLSFVTRFKEHLPSCSPPGWWSLTRCLP